MSTETSPKKSKCPTRTGSKYDQVRCIALVMRNMAAGDVIFMQVKWDKLAGGNSYLYSNY